jgi:guanylate kinase
MNILITLTGPSCAGKSTLEQRLVDKGFARVISNTSRAPRAGEVDGEHYRFRTREWFEEKIADQALIEFVDFNGNFYGNTEYDVMDAMKRGLGSAVWVIEPHGLKQVIDWHITSPFARAVELYRVFVNNPGDVIMSRFLRRAVNDGPANLERNLARLGAMLSTERSWVDEAGNDILMGSKELYDVYLAHFNEHNASTVVDVLLSRRDLSRTLPVRARAA